MPLDPRLQAFMEQNGLLVKPGSPPRPPEVLLTELRESVKQTTVATDSTRESVAQIENLVIPGPAGNLPVRLYTPEGIGPFPVLMFFQKSWCAGNLDTHEMMCRSLCRGAGCLVMTVDYRLAPEYPFPAALEDCYATTSWVVANATKLQGDPTRIAVGGESGGGNFAAAIALMSRDRGGPMLTFQLSICPAADFRVTTDSWKDYDGYMMNMEEFIIVRDFYAPVEERLNPYAAPSLASNLHALPPALIITAECDPLRDSGELYGQRLLEAGVPATITRYDGMVHSFMHLGALIPQANQALDEVIHALRTMFARKDYEETKQ
ncbi:MAG TPA: alpha/beta hydrolase [Ktedonobacteraceae bacterium]|jgi:acetyl esterase|nr:alpha/beta hydrolase [Ktedonobacteraceae bacterium]